MLLKYIQYAVILSDKNAVNKSPLYILSIAEPEFPIQIYVRIGEGVLWLHSAFKSNLIALYMDFMR